MIRKKYMPMYLIAMSLVFCSVVFPVDRKFSKNVIVENLKNADCGKKNITLPIYEGWVEILGMEPILMAIVSGSEECAIVLSALVANKKLYSVNDNESIIIYAINYNRKKLVSEIASRGFDFGRCSKPLAVSLGQSQDLEILTILNKNNFDALCSRRHFHKDYLFLAAVFSKNLTILNHYKKNGWFKGLSEADKKEAQLFFDKQLTYIEYINSMVIKRKK